MNLFSQNLQICLDSLGKNVLNVSIGKINNSYKFKNFMVEIII